MNKFTLISILLIVICSLVPIIKSCITVNTLKWIPENQCFECTNCPNPFNPLSPIVTKKTCGLNTVGCAVSLFIYKNKTLVT
jgi:hypothetical protein